MDLVICPVCSKPVESLSINSHLDAGCAQISASSSASTSKTHSPAAGHGKMKDSKKSSSQLSNTSETRTSIAPIFNIKPKPKSEQLSSLVPGIKRGLEASDRGSTQGSLPLKRSRLALKEAAPLAEKLRPTTLSEFVGHELVVDFIASGCTGSSMILWGPSGCGKTTLARLLATQTDAVFKELSATIAGINDVRAVVEAAKSTLSLTGRKTILFLDEIHRFSKSQQDIFLPFLEQGYIQLIGATTENPSFKLIGALLSRCRVFCLERLQDEEIKDIITKALRRLSSSSSGTINVSPETEPSSSPIRSLTQKIISTIISMSAGDARVAISLLESVLRIPSDYTEEKILTFLRRSMATSYDTAEDHYNMISALHKSVRGSQPDAALYWLARMLTGGEDPMFICRRMIVCASEDIGLADNHAMPLAVATLHACLNIGMPECRINLAHLVAYLSEAPKSTRAYEAYTRAEAAALEDPSLPVPLPMRNAPTALMKEVGYGKSYHYNPQYAHPVHNTYVPPFLEGRSFLKKPNDASDKIWDEDALLSWENSVNGGKQWEGRLDR